MENRRLLLAVFLSALVLIVWYAIFPPPPPQPRTAEEPLPGPEAEQSEQLEQGMAPDAEDSGIEADEPDAEPLVAFEGDSVAAELEDAGILQVAVHRPTRDDFSSRFLIPEK